MHLAWKSMNSLLSNSCLLTFFEYENEIVWVSLIKNYYISILRIKNSGSFIIVQLAHLLKKVVLYLAILEDKRHLSINKS